MKMAARDARRAPDMRRMEREVREAVRDQRPVIVARNDGDRVVFVRRDDRGLIAGCPPGLAKKNNGCLPPGQVRTVAVQADPYNWLWGRSDDRYNYRYDNGYVYRVNQQGSLLGYLPVLGGALSLGQVWPSQYQYQPAPDYYTRYYGLNDQYAYRYADGALYGVDPQTQTIGQIAALLTGQQWNVGQAMPAGYDIYNVPYAYRNQYADSANSLYRYNDGYVYQVDPTTRLIQAAIQLLT